MASSVYTPLTIRPAKSRRSQFVLYRLGFEIDYTGAVLTDYCFSALNTEGVRNALASASKERKPEWRARGSQLKSA